ncbi:hypothetical protein [Pseudorhodoplanes sinuspersici]|nr:hypothetical protein [Pseudorhodoplanes sinuspersici]
MADAERDHFRYDDAHAGAAGKIADAAQRPTQIRARQPAHPENDRLFR